MKSFLLVLDWTTTILYSIALGASAYSYRETGHLYSITRNTIPGTIGAVIGIWLLALVVWGVSKKLLTIQDDPEVKRKALRNMRVSVFIFGGCGLLGAWLEQAIF